MFPEKCSPQATFTVMPLGVASKPDTAGQKMRSAGHHPEATLPQSESSTAPHSPVSPQ